MDTNNSATRSTAQAAQQRILALSRQLASATQQQRVVEPESEFAKQEAERLAEASTKWAAPVDIRGLREAVPGDDMLVLDLGPYFKQPENDEVLAATAATLKQACVATGFHYVVNHGIPQEVFDNAIEAANLYHTTTPTESKMKREISTHPSFPGAGCVSNSLLAGHFRPTLPDCCSWLCSKLCSLNADTYQ